MDRQAAVCQLLSLLSASLSTLLHVSPGYVGSRAHAQSSASASATAFALYASVGSLTQSECVRRLSMRAADVRL